MSAVQNIFFVGQKTQQRLWNTNKGLKNTINQITKSNIEFQVYPNPAHNFVNILCNSKIKNVLVYDFMGKLVVNRVVNNHTITLYDIKLQKGVYLVKAVLENGTQQTQKLLIE